MHLSTALRALFGLSSRLVADLRGNRMKKRLHLLAVGLFAILALSTASQAGLTTVTDNSLLGPPLPTGVTTITELDVTFTPAASPFTNLTLVTPPTLGGSSISSSGDTVSILISPSASTGYISIGQGFANFHFNVSLDVAKAMADVKVTDTIWKTNVGDERGSTTLSFGATAVAPEPSTFAVFGIGMIGLLALQFFKRPVVV